MKNLLFLVALINGVLCFGQDSILIPLDSNKCLHGRIYNYFRDGTPKSFRTYTHGYLYGPYEKFYRNGKIKEKGFLDDVNQWTILFQPSKIFWEKYDKEGLFKRSLGSEIIPMKPVPSGKCDCEDGNIQRLKSLLVGKWVKEKMRSFTKSDQIIDSVFDSYDTEITFLPNDSLLISVNGHIQKGFYILSSNKIELIVITDDGKQESLMYGRWPIKTLNPNSTWEHFDLELIELLNVLKEDQRIALNDVIVKFKRE